MRNARGLLWATLFMAVLAGGVLTVSGPATTAAEKQAAAGSHWHYHDGHWSYWDNGDRRWYYTDGTNWFYNNGDDANANAWNVYRFDKQFGRNGFERGDYKVPGSGVKIATPNHTYYRSPKK